MFPNFMAYYVALKSVPIFFKCKIKTDSQIKN